MPTLTRLWRNSRYPTLADRRSSQIMCKSSVGRFERLFAAAPDLAFDPTGELTVTPRSRLAPGKVGIVSEDGALVGECDSTGFRFLFLLVWLRGNILLTAVVEWEVCGCFEKVRVLRERGGENRVCSRKKGWEQFMGGVKPFFEVTQRSPTSVDWGLCE
jgi:hypothetical protein